MIEYTDYKTQFYDIRCTIQETPRVFYYLEYLYTTKNIKTNKNVPSEYPI